MKGKIERGDNNTYWYDFRVFIECLYLHIGIAAATQWLYLCIRIVIIVTKQESFKPNEMKQPDVVRYQAVPFFRIFPHENVTIMKYNAYI